MRCQHGLCGAEPQAHGWLHCVQVLNKAHREQHYECVQRAPAVQVRAAGKRLVKEHLARVVMHAHHLRMQTGLHSQGCWNHKLYPAERPLAKSKCMTAIDISPFTEGM